MITEAFAIRNQLLSGSDDSIEAMSGRLGMNKCRLTSLIRLSHLAPEIVGALLAGRHPIELTPIRLLRLSKNLPHDWKAVSSASPPKPHSKARRNAPHPTTRKRPRETLWPFGRESRAFFVSGWRCRDRPKANLRKFRGYSSDCQNQKYEAISEGFVAGAGGFEPPHAGHGRYEAGKLNQCAEVPVVWLEHLTETQARAYMLPDNTLTER